MRRMERFSICTPRIPTTNDPHSFRKSLEQCGTYRAEGDCYNREHSFPQSWFGRAEPMNSDVHHIFAVDGYVNGIRSNYPYGEVRFCAIRNR